MYLVKDAQPKVSDARSAICLVSKSTRISIRWLLEDTVAIMPSFVEVF